MTCGNVVHTFTRLNASTPCSYSLQALLAMMIKNLSNSNLPPAVQITLGMKFQLPLSSALIQSFAIHQVCGLTYSFKHLFALH